MWTADKTSLTPGSPVTLTWENEQGLVFRRTISVDDKFMFTVKNAVENRGTAPVTLQPYSLVSRHGRPVTLGYYVLHEGMIGVLGDKGLQEITYANLDKEGADLGRQYGRPDLELASPAASSASPTSTGPLPSFRTRRSPSRVPSPRSRARRPIAPIRPTIAGASQTLQPGATTEVTQRLFAGAKEVATVDAYHESATASRTSIS